MKTFNIPGFYRSSFIGSIKSMRKGADPRKRDFSPTVLDFGPIRFHIARHFGFCYGVENAIEIAYRAIEENPGKQVYLLSQMIHNPIVNQDLESRGIQFLMDTLGQRLMDWNQLTADDVVIVPAFGTTIDIENELNAKGVSIAQYNTTCPFVEKVWKKSAKLGQDGYSVVIHGKEKHEETRATFSHSSENAPSIVVRDIEETKILGEFILGTRSLDSFDEFFAGRYSSDFDPNLHLERLGVVNQTTMLASETQEIADYIKAVVQQKHGQDGGHFADTRDTLCYATNDNQQSTYGLLEVEADLAIVVGGYNSSNTSHLAELCEHKLPTYYISSADEIISDQEIRHYNQHTGEMEVTNGFLPTQEEPLRIVLTSGASCPDAIVDEVLDKLLSYFPAAQPKDQMLSSLQD